jgi:hypothetical protein
VELEYRCEAGDLLAFADLHMRRPAVDRAVRRWLVYGYACFVALLGLIYFRFGAGEFAIVLVVLGPVYIAVWPTGLRWLYRHRLVASARELNSSDAAGNVTLRVDDAGLTRVAPPGQAPFRSIREVVDEVDYLLIYVGPAAAFVMARDRVVRGDPAAFAAAARLRTT